MHPIRHVLCATDLSHNSRRAFDAATTVAKASDGTLVILHVSRLPVFPSGARFDAPTPGPAATTWPRARGWAIPHRPRRLVSFARHYEQPVCRSIAKKLVAP